MNYKLGDHVLVLDEDLSGVIKQITDDTISIETEDGFLIDFKSDELVKKQKKQDLNPVLSFVFQSNITGQKQILLDQMFLKYGIFGAKNF